MINECLRLQSVWVPHGLYVADTAHPKDSVVGWSGTPASSIGSRVGQWLIGQTVNHPLAEVVRSFHP